MAAPKPCNERSKPECSGWQARFMNCKWDTMVGCVGDKPKVTQATKSMDATPVKIDTNRAKYKADGDGKPDDCEVPACRTKTSAFKAVLGGKSKTKIGTKLPCPLESEALGRSTWGFLHSMAANFPEKPSSSDQGRAKQFVETMAMYYPCKHCAQDFQEDIVANPPNVSTRKDFAVWMCNAHNRVNTKLGKPVFSCKIEHLDLRWRDGGKKCE